MASCNGGFLETIIFVIAVKVILAGPPHFAKTIKWLGEAVLLQLCARPHVIALRKVGIHDGAFVSCAAYLSVLRCQSTPVAY